MPSCCFFDESTRVNEHTHTVQRTKCMDHLYADDSQLYISFKNDCFADLAQAKSSVQLCVKDIDWWMTNNMLKLNQEKTELIVISSKFRPKPAISCVSW